MPPRVPLPAADDDPWYRDGLRFTCTMCGKCCTGAPGFVWVNDEEIHALAAATGTPRNEFGPLYTKKYRGKVTLREKANGDCVFFEHGKGCTVYAVRPRQCRTWPFWESNLKSPETWAETEANCPGSGEGELVPADEITRRMKVIKI
jgi:Fe-S-cluster containining protein